jgi:Na+:H+ antiporter, NhaA family
MTARTTRLARARRALIDNSLLLLVGAVTALAWANLAPTSYGAVAHALHFAINDIGMVFFFALAAKEVFEATLPGGPLSSLRTAGTPLVAAAGGMLGPAAIFLSVTTALGLQELSAGWAIPCATDIAFSALVARAIFGTRHPAVPFLLMLAIADDALGLAILAVFYPIGTLHLAEGAAWMGAAMGVAWWLRRRKVTTFWPYVLLAGALSWVALFRGGLHPALAMVPVVPFMPHARSDLGIFDPREPLRRDTLSAFEHWWKVPVEFVLFAFGLVNAGVSFGSVGAGTWLVIVALVVGKPLGIGLFTAGARLLSLELTGVTWRDLVVVGAVAGIGFTVALFFATAAFPDGALLEQTKMGALFSFVAGALAIACAWGLGVGRFARATGGAARR